MSSGSTFNFRRDRLASATKLCFRIAVEKATLDAQVYRESEIVSSSNVRLQNDELRRSRKKKRANELTQISAPHQVVGDLGFSKTTTDPRTIWPRLSRQRRERGRKKSRIAVPRQRAFTSRTVHRMKPWRRRKKLKKGSETEGETNAGEAM